MILHGGRVLLDAARTDPDYEGRLAAGLEAIYGPRTRVSFRDGALALGWGQEQK